MVNKACFKKSVVHDFVWILTIIVAIIMVVIGYLMLNALSPILAPFGTAFNLIILSYAVILFLTCFFPFLGKPEDLKTFPTGGLIIVGYMFGGLPYMGYMSMSLRNQYPDITLITIGWAILMLICIPISMGYARCREG